MRAAFCRSLNPCHLRYIRTIMPSHVSAPSGISTGTSVSAAASSVTTIQHSELAQRQLGYDGLIDFAAGVPGPSSLPLAKVAAAAAHCFASSDADPFILQYAPDQGSGPFRRTLAAYLTKQHGYTISDEELLCTAGASHGLDLACRHLGRPGDLIFVERPTYFLVQPIFEQCGLTAVGVATDHEGIRVDALEKMLLSDPRLRPRLLYTVPTHNNPRGVTLPLERRRKLVELAHQYGFFIVADEVYQLLSFPSAPAPPLPMRAVEAQVLGADAASRPSSVVSLGSFSKMMAPGLRCGWIEASQPITAALTKDGVLGSGGSLSPLAAGMMTHAIHSGLLDEHLRGQVLPTLQSHSEALVVALREHMPSSCSFDEPFGGYFVWLQLPDHVDSKELLALARQSHGVGFAPGPLCHGLANCLRLSFSFFSEDEIREGVKRLAAALEQYLQQQEKQQQQQQRQQAAAKLQVDLDTVAEAVTGTASAQ